MEPIRTFHALSAGLQLGLADLYGLDMRPLDLVAAMDLLLNGPETISDGWSRGEPAFEPAVGGGISPPKSAS